MTGYPYNPAKAKQLLKEAGYPNGFKTKITYITSAQDDQIYTAAQGYFKAIGVDAELDPDYITKMDHRSLLPAANGKV